jgi:hypothetical protein
VILSSENNGREKQADKMVTIRFLFELIVQNCQSSYFPEEYITIDEILLPFRERCGLQ